MEVHLVDGTYELFRHFYAVPPEQDASGREVGAVRGVVASLRATARQGATHIGVATDHVIESFRNRLWPGYKTVEGIAPALLSRFHILEDELRAQGNTRAFLFRDLATLQADVPAFESVDALRGEP